MHPSNRQVDAAGDRLRTWLEKQGALDLQDIQVLEDFRGCFPYPLKKVTVGVRQFVERESTEVLVAQRLKRFPSILAKLSRQPTMRLSQMQDIGGCRAVLPGGKREVDGVLERIRVNDWAVKLLTDYSSTPRATGYRGVHVIVLRDGRLIEIQLRTPLEHLWAEVVERTGARLGYDLKNGEGPPDLIEYFRLASVKLAAEETGAKLDRSTEEALDDLRREVKPYFAKG